MFIGNFRRQLNMPGHKETIRVGRHLVTISNRDKIYFPKEKITKGNIIDYYRAAATLILPYLKDRPENLNRHPNGIDAPGFYQKDITMPLPPWIKTAEIYSESNDKDMHYLVCQNEETLLSMANLGCIEINPWNSRVTKLEKPDYFIIDLDPGDISFAQVIKTAQMVRTILEDMGIESYPKTSGKTGIHIFVPTAGKYTYEEVKQFAEIVARITHERLPKITSIIRDPKKRQTCVYVDYLQNNRGQTLAAPYSVRPASGAPVSAPLKWSEVRAGLDPKKFTIKNILQRVEKVGDLWRPVLGKGVNLRKILAQLARR
jgi:bifunctional non-homologous end joining protein LigD